MAWYDTLFSAVGTAGSAIASPFTTIVKAISDPITAYQSNAQAIRQAEHDKEMSIIKFQQKQIEDETSNNAEWEIKALTSTKPRSPMQWVSFLVLGAPFIIAWFDVDLVQQYFEVALAVIPLWYIKMFVSIIGVVWGIAQLKNAANGINDMMNKRRVMKNALDVAVKTKPKK